MSEPTSRIPIVKAVVHPRFMDDTFDFHLMAERSHAHSAHVLPIVPVVLMNVPQGMTIPDEAAFSLTRESALALMEGMWEAGLRPRHNESEAKNLSSAIAAKDAHIADLRHIVFKTTPNPESNSF